MSGRTFHIINTISLCALIGVTFLGSVSRFTEGRYTPSFYAYQLDRAPNDESTRFVPYIDLTLGMMLLFPRTRKLAAALCVLFQGIGIWMRLREGKDASRDCGLCVVAIIAAVGL